MTTTQKMVSMEKIDKVVDIMANRRNPTNRTDRTRSTYQCQPLKKDEQNDHPKKFLRSLNTCLTHKRIPEKDKRIMIENCLKGKAAE